MKFTGTLFNISLLWFTAAPVFAGDPGSTQKQNGSGFEIGKPSFPDREYVITDFGAVNDGISLNTEAINQAVATCSEAGGGRVVIPEGVWLTGPIRLRDHVNLHVAEGAVVLFSKNFDDYPFVPSFFEGRKVYRAMAPLFGDSVSNIAITGKGVFDGSGNIWRPVKKMKTFLISRL